MYYNNEEKKYYRFPSKTNLIDFEEYAPLYFPTQYRDSKHETDDAAEQEIYKMKGDIL